MRVTQSHRDSTRERLLAPPRIHRSGSGAARKVHTYTLEYQLDSFSIFCPDKFLPCAGRVVRTFTEANFIARLRSGLLSTTCTGNFGVQLPSRLSPGVE